MFDPKVSIVIPVYNGSNYLAEAIEASLRQTYQNVEIIVVNDGSKDDGATAAVAAKYGDKIRYFEKENGGSSSALNYGIRNMAGEWFSWLSHDDLYYPQKIQAQINWLNEQGVSEDELSNCVLFSGSELIEANGQTIRRPEKEELQKTAQRINTIIDNAWLIAQPTENMFHGCSCLVHRSVFDRIGVFDESLRLLNDVDMWFRIYASGVKVRYVPEVLVKGRMHPKQVSRSIGFSYHNPEQDMFWSRSLQWLVDHHPDNAELFALFGANACLKTRFPEGHLAFSRAIDLCPEKKWKLMMQKWICMLRACVRTAGKKIYLLIKQ